MSDPNEKNVIFYEAGGIYEITINLRKQHEGSKSRLKECYKEIEFLVSHLKEVGEVNLITEISEPTYGNIERGSISRVHYHGTLTFYDPPIFVAMFLMSKILILKKNSDFQINKYRADVWPMYMRKQSQIMIPYCKSVKVPYIISSDKVKSPKVNYEPTYFDSFGDIA